MPALAAALGAGVFESKLLPLYFSTFHDVVSSVRTASTAVLRPLTDALGADWAAARAVPKLRELMSSGGNYLTRITVLYAAGSLLAAEDNGSLADDLLPMMLERVSDTVPNVRFSAVKVLGRLAGKVDNERIAAEVLPAVSGLVKDEDADVAYYAGVAVEALS